MGRITSLDELEFVESSVIGAAPIVVFIGSLSGGDGEGGSDSNGDGTPDGDKIDDEAKYWFGTGMPNVTIQYDLQPDSSYSIPGHFKIYSYTVVEPYVEGVATFHLTTEMLEIPLTSATPEITIPSNVIHERILNIQGFCNLYSKGTDDVLTDRYELVTSYRIVGTDPMTLEYIISYEEDLDSLYFDVVTGIIPYATHRHPSIEGLIMTYPAEDFSPMKTLANEVVGYVPYNFQVTVNETIYTRLKNTVTISLPKELCLQTIPDFEFPIDQYSSQFLEQVSIPIIKPNDFGVVESISTNMFDYAKVDSNTKIAELPVTFGLINTDLMNGLFKFPNNLIVDNGKICLSNKLPIFPIYPKYPRGVKNIKFQKAAIMIAHFDDEMILFQPLCELVTHIKVCMYPFNDNFNSIKAQLSYGSKVESIWSAATSDKYTQPTITGFFDTSNLPERDEYLFGNDRLYNQIKSTILDLKGQGIDTIITHSPWGDYGHTHHMWVFSYIHEIAIENKMNVYCINKYMNGVNWENYVIHSRAPTVTPSYEFDANLVYSNAWIFHNTLIEGSSFDCWSWHDFDWNLSIPLPVDEYIDYQAMILDKKIMPAGYKKGPYIFNTLNDDAPPCLMMTCGSYDNTYHNILDTANENYTFFKDQFNEMMKQMSFIGGSILPPAIKKLIDSADFVVPAMQCNLEVIEGQQSEETIDILVTGTDFNATEELSYGLMWTYEWLIEGADIVNLESVIVNQSNLQFTAIKSSQYVTVYATRTARHPILDLCSKRAEIIIPPNKL